MIKKPPTSGNHSSNLPFDNDEEVVTEKRKKSEDAISQPLQEERKKIVKEVPVNIEKNSDEKVPIEFDDSSMGESYSAKQTKIADEPPKIDPTTPASKVREDIARYEKDKVEKLTFKDFQDIAKFLINLFDTGLSTLLNFIGKDTARQVYQLTEPDKRTLSDQLALILCKYQAKFSIEFTFLLAIIVMYSGPTMAAFKNRKKNGSTSSSTENEKQEIKYETKVVEKVVEKPSGEKEVVKETVVEPVNPSSVPFKRPPATRRPYRKPGRQAKLS